MAVSRGQQVCFLLLFFLHGLVSSKHQIHGTFHQRCRNLQLNETSTILEGFQKGTCVKCDVEQNNTQEPPHSEVHVVLLVSSATPETILGTQLILAAALLNNEHQVSILYHVDTTENIRGGEQKIMQALFKQIPCEKLGVAQMLVSFRTLVHNQQMIQCDNPKHSTGDEILCYIQNGSTNLVHFLLSEIQARYSDANVIITESTFMAGVLAAELSLIPSFSLLADDTLEKLQGPVYQPGSSFLTACWRSLHHIVRDCFHSIDLASAFVALNRVRRQLKMKRIASLSDLWRSQVVWLIDSTRWLPNAAPALSPLMPLCVLCDVAPEERMTFRINFAGNRLTATPHQPSPTAHNDTLKFQKAGIPSIVIAENFHGYVDWKEKNRRLMQALSLARTSIPLISDWTGPKDFYVVRPEFSSNGTFGMQPPFVVEEQRIANFYVDTVVSHMPVAGLVAACGTLPWMARLGPPFYCLDPEATPRETAKGILRMLMEPQNSTTKAPVGEELESGATPSREHQENELDSLETMVKMVEKAARLKILRGDVWKDGLQKEEDLFRALNLTLATSGSELDYPLARAWAVYTAWVIVLLALFYFLFKESLSLHTIHRGRRSRLKASQLNPAIIAEEILLRTPELDNVFDLWNTWFWEELAHWEQVAVSTVYGESASRPSTDQYTSPSRSRRRNTSKKRH